MHILRVLHSSPVALVYCDDRCSFIWTKPKSGETGSRLVSKSSCERSMLQRTRQGIKGVGVKGRLFKNNTKTYIG